MSPEDRACEGVFLAFQYPVEIPGVSTANFLKAAINSKRKHHGQDELDAMDFLTLLREKLALVEMDVDDSEEGVGRLRRSLLPPRLSAFTARQRSRSASTDPERCVVAVVGLEPTTEPQLGSAGRSALEASAACYSGAGAAERDQNRGVAA